MSNEFIFFWGENSYLSNFFLDTPFILNGIYYISSEHYFMETKASTWPTNKNKYLQELILKSPTGKQAKSYGIQVEGFNEEVWNKIKFNVMKIGITEKFNQNPFYLNKLLETGNKILIEASPYDKIWGIGMNEKKFLTLDSKEQENILKERNLLGKALMEVREEFKKKSN